MILLLLNLKDASVAMLADKGLALDEIIFKFKDKISFF
jgi:hypothetical protein